MARPTAAQSKHVKPQNVLGQPAIHAQTGPPGNSGVGDGGDELRPAAHHRGGLGLARDPQRHPVSVAHPQAGSPSHQSRRRSSLSTRRGRELPRPTHRSTNGLAAHTHERTTAPRTTPARKAAMIGTYPVCHRPSRDRRRPSDAAPADAARHLGHDQVCTRTAAGTHEASAQLCVLQRPSRTDPCPRGTAPRPHVRLWSGSFRSSTAPRPAEDDLTPLTTVAELAAFWLREKEAQGVGDELPQGLSQHGGQPDRRR